MDRKIALITAISPTQEQITCTDRTIWLISPLADGEGWGVFTPDPTKSPPWLLAATAPGRGAARHAVLAGLPLPVGVEPPPQWDAIHFAARLLECRARRGVSQRDVADYIGATPAYVSHLELGRRRPTLEHFLQVATYFGVSPLDLLSPNVIDASVKECEDT